MFKSLIVFGLTRRAIIVIGVLTFIGVGIAAFFRLNIEAYPNPAPVIIEITAQSPGLAMLSDSDEGKGPDRVSLISGRHR